MYTVPVVWSGRIRYHSAGAPFDGLAPELLVVATKPDPIVVTRLVLFVARTGCRVVGHGRTGEFDFCRLGAGASTIFSWINLDSHNLFIAPPPPLENVFVAAYIGV